MTDVFENLCRLLVIARPADPIAFLIDVLENRRVQRLFMISGVVATNRNEIVQTIANIFNYKVISTEDLFQGDVGWVDNTHINETIYEQLKKTERHYRGVIISGYPNNLIQGQYLQNKGILAERMFLLESDEEQVKQYYETIQNPEDIPKAIIRDRLNRKELEQLYAEYMDVFNISKKTKDDIVDNIKQIIKLRDRKHPPLRFPRVAIIRPPSLKERAQQLAQLFSKRYGLKSIVTFKVIEQAISNKGELGPLLSQSLLADKPLPFDVVNSLLYNEFQSTEARTKGFVVEGYPKSQEELKFLNNQNINLFVVLNEDEDVLINKAKQLKLDPVTRIKYEKVPLNNKPLLDRLVNYQVDDDSKLRQRIVDYQNFVKQVEEQYGDRVQIFKLEKDTTENILRITDVFLNNPKIYN